MPDIKRRDFLKRTIQVVISSGLIATGFSLGLRKSNDDKNQDNCVKIDPCNRCNQFTGCTQPKALSVKKDYLVKPLRTQRRQTIKIHLNQ